MFIGTFFYFWYNKEITTKSLIVFLIIGYMCSNYTDENLKYENLRVTIPNLLAIIFFAYCAFYVQWKNQFFNKILAFFADISYPLYLVHPAIGYHVSILLNKTYLLNPFLTFLFSATVSITIAFLLHKAIEYRFNEYSRKLTS